MKNFTNNFKQFTSRLSARWLIMALMMLVGTSSAWAGGGAGGPMGVYLGVNGNNTWYKINGVNSWNMSCSGYAFDNANALPSSLGNITSGLSLEGLGIIGWTDSGSDWVAGKINYTITPGSKSGSYETGNFENPSWGNGGHVRCSSGNNRVTAVKSSVNLIDGLGAGDYTLKFEYFARMQWQNNNGNGYYDDNNGNARGTKSATFTIPGYSTTTGEKSFGEVEVNSTSDYTIELTHYGSDNTATVSITGTNKSEFTATVTKSGDNKQILIVTFKPTSVAQDKTATIKVTDAYNKTYTLNVTGTGKQSCQAPTSVSITRSDAPSTANICQGSTLNLTADVSGGNGDIKYEWEQVDGTDWSVSANSTEQTCTVKAGTGIAHFKIKATQCEETVEATIELTADAKPSLELASSPTVCPNVQIDLDNYVNLSTIGTVTWYYEDNRATVITDGLVTPTERTTYYAKVINGTCNPVENEFTVNVYGIADDMPAYTSTPATSCKETPNSDGTIALKNTIGYITYTLDGKEGDSNVWTRLSVGTHKLAATINTCPSLTKEWDVEVGVEDITPTATVSIIGDASFCEGGNTVLTSVVTATQGEVTAYQWYNGEELIQGATASRYTANAAGNYKVVVTVLNSTCQDEFWSNEKVVTINPKPSEPVLSIPSPICAGSNFTLPEEDNNQRTITWNVNNRELTNLTAGTHNYTAKIIDVKGCESNEVTYTITVTALPEITSISQDVQEPVFYEDVTLTANATQGATVKWYEGGVEKATGATYVVTSETATSKTVTAKAFLNGCESAVASHKVNFEAEGECEHEIINNTNKTKVRVKKISNWNTIKIYAHSGQSSGNWPGTNMTAGTGEDAGYYVYTFESVGSNFKVIFNNGSSNGENQTVSATATKGKVCTYTIGANSCSEDNNSRRCLTVTTTDYKTTGDVIITTPAVKMLSAFSEEGSGVLRMTAQIVKTGCNGNMTYYFKYRLKGAQAWSQTQQQTATGLKAGDEINATVSNLDQGGTYEIQAVINNNNEAVSNILEYVVNIQETAISNVTLKHADADGFVLQNQNPNYCVGSTAYIKLSYDGTAHKSLEWIAENELQPIDGKDKLYSYIVRGEETITANVANDENEGTPATGSIDINVYTIATTPDISIDRTEVCSSDQVGAKITVNAPQIGITYQAYKKVDDVETPHGDPVVANNAESIIINSIKETGTYYVKAWNAQCRDAIAVSLLKFAVTKIEASSNTIAITPETASTNPWMPVSVKVDKNSAYDYTLVCKQGETDVTDQMVINKKGDSYVIKFPKPESAVIEDGQVVFDNITYSVTVSLNGNVECGTTSATSTVTLTNLIEDCD